MFFSVAFKIIKKHYICLCFSVNLMASKFYIRNKHQTATVSQYTKKQTMILLIVTRTTGHNFNVLKMTIAIAHTWSSQACSNLDPFDTSLLSCHQDTEADGIPKTVHRSETFRPETISTIETSSEAASSRVTSRWEKCGASLTENSEAGERRRELEAGGVEEGATCGRQANSRRSREVRVRF